VGELDGPPADDHVLRYHVSRSKNSETQGKKLITFAEELALYSDKVVRPMLGVIASERAKLHMCSADAGVTKSCDPRIPMISGAVVC
jgi:hypothetical protein